MCDCVCVYMCVYICVCVFVCVCVCVCVCRRYKASQSVPSTIGSRTPGSSRSFLHHYGRLGPHFYNRDSCKETERIYSVSGRKKDLGGYIYTSQVT